MGVTCKQALKKLSIKIDEYSGQYLTTLAALDKLKIAWKEYCAAKKEAWGLRKSFLEDKIARKAHHWAESSETMLKMMICEECSIEEGVGSRQIGGKNNKKPVLKAEIINFITGITRTVYTQEDIVAAAAESSIQRQSLLIDTAIR